MTDQGTTNSAEDTLISIGYEDNTVHGLVAQLLEQDVRILVDVPILRESSKPGRIVIADAAFRFRLVAVGLPR